MEQYIWIITGCLGLIAGLLVGTVGRLVRIETQLEKIIKILEANKTPAK